MTGYEIIKRNIEFSNPDRIGIKFQSLGEGDMTRIYLQRSKEYRNKDEVPNIERQPKPYTDRPDEWGVSWDSHGESNGLGQPVSSPLEDIEEQEEYVFPDINAEGRFDGLEEALQKAEKEGKWVQFREAYFLFERHHMIRSYEEALMDLYIDEENSIKLIDRILEYHLQLLAKINELAPGRIHSYETSDDWGTQTNLQISPELWRKIYKPRYKKFADAVHSYGMYFELHSCGFITDIMEDLIEVGVDMVQINQPGLMGMEEFGNKFRGRIVFDVGADIQSVLPTHNKELISKHIQDLIKHWGTPNGGIIAAEYRFPESIGATQEDMEYALECWKKYGDLKN
ncbi:hypothetical protein AN639_01890 [Candidatus Epulonipiscium fishelsonii]|uniref:Uncharacterized protein n=1 Tax=Candidatus Epulonipiscium fishelsonii TaxID=77094 RepID=A0ACC8X8U9_9FIRM|nr:hypothetical protein AN396_10850 [Epulopiscium sp. SCG-B11WGA-EpuloA1]ONI38956.1 hypothetical protein AN639_01890 [Epulopiscium sp. SCG-B05WGA-EpuloA1]